MRVGGYNCLRPIPLQMTKFSTALPDDAVVLQGFSVPRGFDFGITGFGWFSDYEQISRSRPECSGAWLQSRPTVVCPVASDAMGGEQDDKRVLDGSKFPTEPHLPRSTVHPVIDRAIHLSQQPVFGFPGPPGELVQAAVASQSTHDFESTLIWKTYLKLVQIRAVRYAAPHIGRVIRRIAR
jgi:hypothetical protein